MIEKASIADADHPFHRPTNGAYALCAVVATIRGEHVACGLPGEHRYLHGWSGQPGAHWRRTTEPERGEKDHRCKGVSLPGG